MEREGGIEKEIQDRVSARKGGAVKLQVRFQATVTWATVWYRMHLVWYGTVLEAGKASHCLVQDAPVTL